MPYAKSPIYWTGSTRPDVPEPFDDESGLMDMAIASGAREQPYILMGPVGTGKSSLMALTALHVHNPTGGSISMRTRHLWLDKRVLWTQSAELYRDILAEIDHRRSFPDFDQNYSASGLASVVPCLFIDDLGTESRTPGSIEAFEVLIDARYRAKLPTWITTNLGIEGLVDRYGQRTASRMVGQSDFYNVGGNDRRMRKPMRSAGATTSTKRAEF